MQRRLAMLESRRCGAKTRKGTALSIPCHAERPLPNARRQINRRTQGQQERLEARVLRRDSEG